MFASLAYYHGRQIGRGSFRTVRPLLRTCSSTCSITCRHVHLPRGRIRPIPVPFWHGAWLRTWPAALGTRVQVPQEPNVFYSFISYLQRRAFWWYSRCRRRQLRSRFAFHETSKALALTRQDEKQRYESLPEQKGKDRGEKKNTTGGIRHYVLRG